jgi:AraC-like DNA-binding protein
MSEIKICEGITLNFFSTEKEHLHTHAGLEHVLEINYCKSGRIGWEMHNGNKVFLGHGDFSIHTMKTCAASKITLPLGFYEGLTISLDTKVLAKKAPALFIESKIDIEDVYKKFCENEPVSSFAGNEESEAIFKYFYDQPAELQNAYYKLKILEIVLYLLKLEPQATKPLDELHSEQAELVREIHDFMFKNMGQRFTIEELSKKYLLNPTTLKSVFKTIYGDSVASHIKKHRLEYAAKELLNSEKSLSEISLEIGYENQSKFTAAFKEQYNFTPREYRKEKAGR